MKKLLQALIIIAILALPVLISVGLFNLIANSGLPLWVKWLLLH